VAADHLVLCLVVAGRLVCPYDPQSFTGGSLVLLVGLTMPDRLQVRGQTKQHPLGVGSATLPYRKNVRYRNAMTHTKRHYSLGS